MEEFTVKDLYMKAQTEFNHFISNSPTNKEVLSKLFKLYKLNCGYSRKIDLLKQYCLERSITGVSFDKDLVLYNSSSANFEYNNDVLEQELEHHKNEVKRITLLLKEDIKTVKINKKTIAIKAIQE